MGTHGQKGLGRLALFRRKLLLFGKKSSHPCARSVRNLRHRQPKAFTELRDAFEIEVELILGAQRRHLFRVALCGRELAEKVFESAGRNHFDDLAWGAVAVPERVPLLAGLEHPGARASNHDLFAKQRTELAGKNNEYSSSR